MNSFEATLNIMKNMFSKDYQFALATATNNIPSLRYVDTYFDGEYFYIVTHSTSKKCKEIESNPYIALSARKMHTFNGLAYNIGHPLSKENEEIRKTLIKTFEPWYFAHNNEDDENMCYLRIEPTTGFFHQNGIGYKIDFSKKTVKNFPFTFKAKLTDD